MSSYYLLPKGNIQLDKCFQLEYSEISSNNILSPSLTHYLYELLNNEQINSPDFFKLQNDIHPYYNKILTNHKYSPDFFELYEIIQTMHLNKYIENHIKTPLNVLSFEKNTKTSASLAFQYIKHNSYLSPLIQNDMYFYWNYTLYNSNAFEKIYLNHAAKTHVIIANNIKYMNNKSILIQMCMALCIQCKKGIFIWKMGETYTQLSLEILYFLSSFYEKIYIIKPSVIDISKSEKYVVCKGFLYENSYSIYTYLHSFVKYIDSFQPPKKNICRFLNIHIPNFFIGKLEEVHYILGQTQLEQIQYLLLLLSHKYKDEKIKNIEKLNEQKCIEWCRKNRFFIHP